MGPRIMGYNLMQFVGRGYPENHANGLLSIFVYTYYKLEDNNAGATVCNQKYT